MTDQSSETSQTVQSSQMSQSSQNQVDSSRSAPPTQKPDAQLLFSKMMIAIQSAHTFGNNIRMVKLPLIFLDDQLYAGAIANFYWLTRAMEEGLERLKSDWKVERVRSLQLHVSPGYEKDLKQLYGKESWLASAKAARTPATEAYVKELEEADATQIVAAAFILYGALVIGGGRATQAKVKKVFPACDHLLFDVSGGSMLEVRTSFRECFNNIGKEVSSEIFDELVRLAAYYMSMNNTVVISIRCTSVTALWRPATCLAIAIASAATYKSTSSDGRLLPACCVGAATGTAVGFGMWRAKCL